MKMKRPLAFLFLFLFLTGLTGVSMVLAQGGDDTPRVTASCPGGPTIDGVTLDECITRSFSVGGITKSVTVWYTKQVSTVQRTQDGTLYNLTHYINSDAEAQQVAAWAEEAWKRYYADSGHHPYDNGCGNNINLRMEDGIGWSGIAYWASSGSCWIGIDSPTIRGGGGQWTVYHEMQHYLQYSYDSGCYGYFKPHYPDDSEFVEGYADLGADTVSASLDATGYSNNGYDPATSMYKKSYGNRFNKYFIEQLGTKGTPSDPWHHIDAMYNHYRECDAQNTLYVLDTLIPSLSGGKWTKEEFFLNFFAANWAKDWADPATQPELVYWDDDGSPYQAVPLTQDVNMASGSRNWAASTPDKWAAHYYQVRPQTGCDYVQVDVDGDPGAKLGINLMAADTGAPSVLRSAWIGEDFVRTFAGAGVHNRIVAVVNSFDHNYSYNVTFTCVSPTIDIQEPLQTKFAMVGDPASPIAFLARFRVTSGGAPVRGLVESSFTFDAGGDAATIVPGSLQEVGQEYWATLLPPTKAAGTTFVDFKACVASSCDTETNALLYVDPGNTNTALVFDASGSMGIEDIIGEGRRVDNAKKAGDVIADLLRNGDRILVTDFSALNNPPGCGLPGGTGNCTLDIQTRLARTDVTTGTTMTVHLAISNIITRAWTPIGAALTDAKDKLLAPPTNSNPNYIYLLSDGEENVLPLYADVRTELINSGVVINTIGFGPDAPGALLAQIAADTGGVYRPVPTTIGGTPRQSVQARRAQLDALGVPARMAERLAIPLLPGQLALADVYDDYDTQAQDAARVFHAVYTATTSLTWETTSAYVDKTASVLRFVVAGKQPDDNSAVPCGYYREVEVLPPPSPNQRDWIPISPPTNKIPPPADWDIRNYTYDDVLIVPNPTEGNWQFRTRYGYNVCRDGQPVSNPPARLTALESDFMMNMSLQSTIRLEGRLLNLTGNQGEAGDVVPVVATLMGRTGAISGALVAAAVEKPGGTDFFWLFDDGLHHDGGPGDGIYGWPYALTNVGGSYHVRIVALFPDPANPANTLFREWNGGFWIKGPAFDVNDQDDDGMPADWELRCKLDPNRYDAQEDLDRDGLSNYDEFLHGTLPCRPDTDGGGERDGSEVNGGRNPLWPDDDLVRPLGKINIRPLNTMVLIQWRWPLSYTTMRLYTSTISSTLGSSVDMGQTGLFTLTGLTNGTTYYLRLAGVNGAAEGDYSDPLPVTPKADPDPPSGAVLIENGADVVTSTEVTLYISSSDTPLQGAAEGANGHMTDRLSLRYNEVSGNVEMRLSNDPTMAGATWEPLAQQKAWTLACDAQNVCTVYAQFRDGAGNESLVVFDQATLNLRYLYLPLILK